MPPAATPVSATAPLAIEMMPTTGTAAGSATATSGPAALPTTAPATALPAARRPIVETTSPERYRVQFTIGKESHDKLRRVQALLRREIPDGDPGARSRMVTRARSSTARSPSFWRGSKSRSWARRRNRERLALSAPGRITQSRAASPRGTRRATSSDRPGGTMEANPPRISRCAAGATISTRPRWSSVLAPGASGPIPESLAHRSPPAGRRARC
jgi:hypothetical protein